MLVLCVSLLAGCGTDKGKAASEDSSAVTENNGKAASEDSSAGTEDNGTTDNDGVLTPKYVCEKFSMDESEFEGVDFDAFVSYYGLTYDNIGEGDLRFLLNDYKAMENKTEIPDYTSMKITTDKFLSEYQDKAEVVVIEDVKGENCQITILDFELGKVFSASGSLDNITAADIVRDADDTVKKAVMDSMDKNNICNWTASNENADEDITGTEAGCTIIIKMSDETCYGISYKPGGAADDMDKFVSDMEAMASLSGK